MAPDDERMPRQIALAEAVTRAIGDRKVKAAVFTTFEFDPGFFELHVLPCLFPEVGWSNRPNVKRVQVGKALIGIDHVAVFYDRRGLKPYGGSARLDYDRIALTRPAGVFHAKNILLLVENQPDDGEKGCSADQSLVVVTTSANLTQSGWHENLEVAHVLEIEAGDSSVVRDDLLGKDGRRGFFAVFEQLSPARAPHPAVQSIRHFLRKRTQSTRRLKHGGRLVPRMYVSGRFADFVREAARIEPGEYRLEFADFVREAACIEPGEYCLEIVSPFFENTADAPTLRALIRTLDPVETRIYLPLADNGTVRCSDEFFKAMQVLGHEKNVHWARLPDDMTRWSRKGDKVKHRNVHAKVYRLFKRGRSSGDWRDVQVVGSVNLTAAAQEGGTKRNFETAILVDLNCEHRPDWWMHRVAKLPAVGAPMSDDEEGVLEWHELTLQFDWDKDVLRYFWKAEPERPQQASVLAGSSPLFEFDKIEFDAWHRLNDSARDSIREHLKSSSLVKLQVEGEQPQPLLVQEVNMDQKPDLAEQLTAAEILEYWSLLTPDQRNEFLEIKLAVQLEPALGQQRVKLAEPSESFFDRFAGIFHAFSCLEEHVLEALERSATKDARYRLLGTSYDSLPTLARQVRASVGAADCDLVVAYVTLLRATEVFGNLRRRTCEMGIKSEFLDTPEIANACKRYRAQWAADCAEVKSRIWWDAEPEPAAFFAWYEREFGKPPPVGGTQERCR